LWREDLGSDPTYTAYWMINGKRPEITQPPARFGEHNHDVLAKVLGKTDAEIQDLRDSAVVGDSPVPGAELGIRPSQLAAAAANE
jgi:crotonobetainyl-CoA:carnitine CoA-transferase CaiB-like acyl-CoA transferase